MNGKQSRKGFFHAASRASACAFHAAVVLACFVAPTARGQSFQNLDFESIGAPSIDENGIWLAWWLAAPGWTHAVGGDSVFVYHNTPPDSHVGQYYFLADSASTQWLPLAGEFSLTLVSGHYNRNDPASAWVNAAVEQSGAIPADAKSFQMLAVGDFRLSVNSTPLPVVSLGDDWFSADISAFAGDYVALRIENTSHQLHTPLIVDNLGFSPQAVPEPSALALLAVAAALRFLRCRC